MYVIMGKYNHRVEEIDTAESRKEARFLLSEYRLAFGMNWELWVKEI